MCTRNLGRTLSPFPLPPSRPPPPGLRLQKTKTKKPCHCSRCKKKKELQSSQAGNSYSSLRSIVTPCSYSQSSSSLSSPLPDSLGLLGAWLGTPDLAPTMS